MELHPGGAQAGPAAGAPACHLRAGSRLTSGGRRRWQVCA
jgi:hypothetical protein